MGRIPNRFYRSRSLPCDPRRTGAADGGHGECTQRASGRVVDREYLVGIEHVRLDELAPVKARTELAHGTQ